MDEFAGLPRLETLVRLVGVLGVEVADLLDGIAWEPNVSIPGGLRITPEEDDEDAPEDA